MKWHVISFPPFCLSATSLAFWKTHVLVFYYSVMVKPHCVPHGACPNIWLSFFFIFFLKPTTQIYLVRSSFWCLLPPLGLLKGTFFSGTLTPVACPASLEQMLPEERPWGLITLILRSVKLLPGVSHSKYTWLPLVDALWPLAFHTNPVCVGYLFKTQDAFTSICWMYLVPAGSWDIKQEVVYNSAFEKVKNYSGYTNTLLGSLVLTYLGKSAALNLLQMSVLLFCVPSCV